MDEPASSGISATVRLTVTIDASAEQVQAAMNETGEAATAGPDAQARALADQVRAVVLDAPGVVGVEVDAVDWEGGEGEA